MNKYEAASKIVEAYKDVALRFIEAGQHGWAMEAMRKAESLALALEDE
jgi:hypothetical protein